MTRIKRVLLIDADTLVYAAATRCEQNHDWGEGVWTLVANIDEAKAFFKNDLKRIVEACNAEDYVVVLSDYDNPRWREGVLPSYKKNRVQRRPLVYDALRKWVQGRSRSKKKDCLEGDDVLGILLTSSGFMPGWEKVCVSIDKDMQQIPGLHVNYQQARDNRVWTPLLISERDADYFHMYQTLTGDSVDGYKGCPGVGPKRATKALAFSSHPEDWWPIVCQEYENKNLTPADALQQARVARICRATDYNYEKEEVILWSPNSS